MTREEAIEWGNRCIQIKSSEDQVYTYNNKTMGDYEVSDRGIERIVKVDGMGGYTSTLVMSKEAFIEAYEKYIKQSREETAEEIKVSDEVLKQESCEDAISRQAVKEQMIKYGFHAPNMTVTEFVEDLPPVTSQESVLDKIRTEIIKLRSKQNVGVLECLDIIDKYRESEDEE